MVAPLLSVAGGVAELPEHARRRERKTGAARAGGKVTPEGPVEPEEFGCRRRKGEARPCELPRQQDPAGSLLSLAGGRLVVELATSLATCRGDQRG
jgi:hypothetical protein